MPSIIDDPRIKKKCQIFTPADVVNRMLDMAGYNQLEYGKSVLENSCGDGGFLYPIVERYIRRALENNIGKRQIRCGLERDIVAYDVDRVLVKLCKKRLNRILSKYGVGKVKWNIQCRSFLSADEKRTYDFVVGNPPYIAYPDLPAEEQKYLRENFLSCKKGKFDYSYAFIEKSYKLLANGGCLVYIIPTNIFKNVFAEPLRELFKSDLTEIVDFPQDRIFEKALVSPAIIKIVKGSCQDFIHYTISTDGEDAKKEEITKASLSKKWVFKTENKTGRRVCEFFKVANTLATLCNDVFVLKNGTMNGDCYFFDNHKIEATLLKKTSSPKSKKYARDSEYIIFPYHFGNAGVLLKYTEDEMYQKFPGAMQYLEKFKEKLTSRDADNSAKWYEYGRSQALQDMGREMIMISSIISDCTKAYLLGKDEIPYSGLYIIPTGQIGLNVLLEKLNSDSFRDYIKNVGISVSGTSKRITANDISAFLF